ncbi:MAG: UDP-3-O-(3-hydroxymyristoyl)glucosamine N-acyltransferase [Chlamydiales bacterium]
MTVTYTLEELAIKTQSKLVGNPSYTISGVDELSHATSRDVSFLSNRKYIPELKTTQAGAICIDECFSLLIENSVGKNFLISHNPSLAFQTILSLFISDTNNQSGFTGIHPTAVIHPTAFIDSDVHIGPYTVIDQNVTIGAHTVIYPNVYIGSGTKIGSNCTIHSGVVIREKVLIGDRVILQPGAIIGSCGFGYFTCKDSIHTKLEQLGTVIIEDDVEIGAGTTIDRARFKATYLKSGTKIDNLVQVGHNVTLGENNLIVAQAGIAGSSKTGASVVIGGQVGIVGHVAIADKVAIGSQSGIHKSVTEVGTKLGGSPAISLSKWRRNIIHFNKISDHIHTIQQLEKRILALEKNISNCELSK